MCVKKGVEDRCTFACRDGTFVQLCLGVVKENKEKESIKNTNPSHDLKVELKATAP